MKTLTGTLLTLILFGLITNSPVWARGSDGQRSVIGGGGSGGSSFRGSSGGRSHFGGGHRHFRHTHNRFNLGINLGGYYGSGFYGSGFYGSGFYGYPYRYGFRYPRPYYYPRTYVYQSPVIIPSAPTVYIQRETSAAASAQPRTNYWHYCRNPEGYYPYVKQCPEGWLQVAPQPAPQ